MYTKLQLDIIREFGRKELTEGCYVIVDSVGQKYSDRPQKGRMAKYITDGKYLSRTQILTCNDRNRRFKSSWELREILGAIPHLEDVFRVAEERGLLITAWRHTIEIETDISVRFGKHIPFNPTLPLLDQDESTLTQLLILFKNDN